MDDLVEAKKLHGRFKLVCDTPLGVGTFGVVQKVQFHSNNRSICLARKMVRPPYRRYPMANLLEEAKVMEKLDHEHIIKVVGTYCMKPSLYILLWPVAVCSLDCLLADIDALRTGQGDQDDTIARLHALDLKDLSAVAQPPARTSAHRGNCPIQYLRQIMGCITRAVAYCHDANIRHLDLKPSNILLNSGRVYLADFGIAKDVHNRDSTMTMGVQGTPKWRAPEAHQSQAIWSMKAADVYSLGLVLLNIAATIYYAPLDDFDAMLRDVKVDRADNLREYTRKLESLALATQQVEDANAPTFGPKHIVDLASRMASKDPSSRPVIFQVNSELVELGGIEQVYHSPCCKSSSRFVTERMNTRLKVAVDERNRLRAEHDEMAKRLQCLEANHETYETRLVNERKAHADKIANLQTQIRTEQAEKKRLEALVAELQQNNRRQHRPGIPRPPTDRQAGANPGLTMRPRRAHPSATPARPPPPPTQIHHPTPTPSTAHNSPRPSYSQTAAFAATAAIPPTTTTITPLRKESLIPIPTPSPTPSPNFLTHTTTNNNNNNNNNPSPDLSSGYGYGYPLRSRPSGSRLPRAVNPTTPIRSNTPLLNRDSSAESTQYSMTSSVFSLHRLSASKGSLGEDCASVLGSPVGEDKRVGDGGEGRRVDSPTAVPEGFGGHGLGLGMTDPCEVDDSVADLERRGSVVTGDRASVMTGDGVSVVTGDGASVLGDGGLLSPVLSGSAVSSPRLMHAAVEGVMRVPALPTAKSWADVARKRRA